MGMCQVWPLGSGPAEGDVEEDAEGLAEGEIDGDTDGLTEAEGPGLGCAAPPWGTCWTVVAPALPAGTLTVMGLREVPPSVNPRTGGGPLGSSRAQFCPDPSKVTSQRGL